MLKYKTLTMFSLTNSLIVHAACAGQRNYVSHEQAWFGQLLPGLHAHKPSTPLSNSMDRANTSAQSLTHPTATSCFIMHTRVAPTVYYETN